MAKGSLYLMYINMNIHKELQYTSQCPFFTSGAHIANFISNVLLSGMPTRSHKKRGTTFCCKLDSELPSPPPYCQKFTEQIHRD